MYLSNYEKFGIAVDFSTYITTWTRKSSGKKAASLHFRTFAFSVEALFFSSKWQLVSFRLLSCNRAEHSKKTFKVATCHWYICPSDVLLGLVNSCETMLGEQSMLVCIYVIDASCANSFHPVGFLVLFSLYT